MISLILFGVFAVLLILAVPIAVALALAAGAAIVYGGSVNISYLPQGMVTSVDSFPLMAVPFFILAGDLMGHGGLSQRLLKVAAIFFGRYTGGLALVAIVTCMFFAAISGSGPATVAAIGGIMLPAMEEARYDRGWSVGLIATAGSIGIIIPPSIPMIIYGISANVSITEMFIAGIVPGIFFGIVLMVVAWWGAKRRGYKGESKRYEKNEAWSIIWEAKWALLVPVIILGGIYGGVFTPTEAAAVAVIYGLVVSLFVYRELTLGQLYKVAAESGLTSAIVILIVGTATVFGRVLTVEQIPVRIAENITALTDNMVLVLILINVLLVVVGMFMETLAAIIILTPILLPVVVAVGVDPVHFGIIMIVNLAMGMATPPVGVNLFVGSRIGSVPLETAARGAMTFVMGMTVSLLLITFVPSLSTGLVDLLR